MIISVWYTRDFIEKILTPNLSFQKLSGKAPLWTPKLISGQRDLSVTVC